MSKRGGRLARLVRTSLVVAAIAAAMAWAVVAGLNDVHVVDPYKEALGLERANAEYEGGR